MSEFVCEICIILFSYIYDDYIGLNLSYRTKFLGASLLLALTIATIVTMNTGLGTYVQYTGKVTGVKYSGFPTSRTTITHTVRPAVPDPHDGEGDTETRTYTYSDDQRSRITPGKYYRIVSERRPWTLYGEPTEITEVFPETIQLWISEIESSSDSFTSWTRIFCRDREFIFRGNYYHCLNISAMYEITFVGDTLLGFQQIRRQHPEPSFFSAVLNSEIDSLSLVILNEASVAQILVGLYANDELCELPLSGVSISPGGWQSLEVKVPLDAVRGVEYRVKLVWDDGLEQIKWVKAS